VNNRSKLDYARPEPHRNSLAIAAMICGLCSGPAGYGLALFLADNHLAESVKELRGELALVLTLGGASVFAYVVRVRLPITGAARDRVFANIGVVAPIAWCAAGIAVLIFALADL
jgi:hypothetical protein